MTNTPPLITQIQQDMRQAMKRKDLLAVNTLRSVLARIHNAEAVPQRNETNLSVGVGSTEAARKQLSEHDIQSIIIDELEEINTTFHALDPHSEYAAELQKKAGIVQTYLKGINHAT